MDEGRAIYRGDTAERLASLRAELKRRGVDGFLVPRTDEYQGEYVPESAQRLTWLTGFTGSAGLAILPLKMSRVVARQNQAGQLDAVLATRSEIESVMRGDPAFPVQDVPFERLPRAGWAGTPRPASSPVRHSCSAMS